MQMHDKMMDQQVQFMTMMIMSFHSNQSLIQFSLTPQNIPTISLMQNCGDKMNNDYIQKGKWDESGEKDACYNFSLLNVVQMSMYPSAWKMMAEEISFPIVHIGMEIQHFISLPNPCSCS